MKKFILTGIFLFFCSLILPNTTEAAAACSQGDAANCECNDIQVVNNESEGSVTNTFRFKAQDCNRAYTYRVHVQKSNSDRSFETLFYVDLTQEYCGPTGYCLQNGTLFPLNSSGEYRAFLYSRNTETGQVQADRYTVFFVSELGETDDGDDALDAGLDASAATCEGGSVYILSAFGCIPFGDTLELAAGLANIGVGLGGGVAFLLIAIAAFKLKTSQGNPQGVQGAKELLMGAIAGIIMVILSAFILNFLGVKILGLF